ncbi:MAG: PKD domain-containing protein, partial [Bacteroidia bacterium]|nr:PKD domain-containing protein [Bacteroidia bacterium]NNM16813.1 PKD domain-containing protein [Bacteroidia bacterium]
MKRILLLVSIIFALTAGKNIHAQSAQCIDSSLIAPPVCPFIYAPVCGCNGVTYSNDCIAQKTDGVAIWTQGPCNSVGCQANFGYSILNNTVTFTDSSGSGISTWFWTFGDGGNSTLASPIYTYANPGTYNVCLVIVTTSGCTSTYCDSVTITGTTPCIDPALIDSFAICPAIYAPVCGCDGITYPNSCVAEKYAGVTSWTTGPCLVGGCQANFTFISTGNPNQYSFNDASTGGTITNWIWDFGDGNTSTMQNPIHTYSQPGTYNVCLGIVDNTGCIDTTCQTLTVVGVPCVDPNQIDSTVICTAIYAPVCGCNNVTYSNSCVAEFYGGVTSWTTGPCSTGGGCQADFGYIIGFNPLAVTFTDSSIVTNDSIVSWNWDFGDGTVSNQQNPGHIYAQSGTYTVCLTIVTASGCTDTLCIPITVSGGSNCTAGFTYNVGPTGNVTFTNQSTGAAPLTYVWDLGDGTNSNQQDPQHLYATGGVYSVC